MENKYEGLSGADFLRAYLVDRGVTERELDYFWSWYGFCVKGLLPNEEGLAYAKRRADRLIAYRDMTLEEIEADEDATPWAWPTAMDWEPCIGGGPEPCPADPEPHHYGILCCCYQGKKYYFGINKPEAEITQDMSENGKWYCYTWSD